MVKILKYFFSGLAGLIVVLVAITFVALEGTEVVTVITQVSQSEPDSNTRKALETHVWYIQQGANIFLEAGHPNNPWVEDIKQNPEVILRGPSDQSALNGTYISHLVANPEGHQEIRKLMRAKHGWRDQWIAWLFDTSQSQLVRLERL